MSKRNLFWAILTSIGATFLMAAMIAGFIYLTMPITLYSMKLVIISAIVGAVILLWYIILGIFGKLGNNGKNKDS